MVSVATAFLVHHLKIAALLPLHEAHLRPEMRAIRSSLNCDKRHELSSKVEE